MKPLKKSTATFLIIFISIVLVIGLIFTFIPMTFGNTRFLSFVGNINYASDIKAGMYAEYKVSSNTTDEQISLTVKELKSILAGEGYQTAFVAGIGENTIRVEIGLDPSGDYSKTQSTLEALGVGVFELRTGTEESKTFINGRDHITDVIVGSSGGASYVQIVFNEAGLEQYMANMTSSSTIYVYMGGNLQTSFSGSTPQTNDMYLTFEDFAQAEDFALRVKLGSLVPIDFLANETVVNSMSSPFSTVGLTADFNSDAYNKSNVFVAIVIAIALSVVATLVFMIIRFRAFGIAQLLALLCDIVLFIILLQALPWVEISLSSTFVIMCGFAMLFFGSLLYIFKVQSEFMQGKTLTASLESGYKKSIFQNSAISIAAVVLGFVIAIFGQGALQVSGVIIILFSLLSALNNLLLLPLFVNIYHTFNSTKSEHYGLKNGGKTDEN